MEHFCRNDLCEYYRRPIDVPVVSGRCPKCHRELFGGSMAASSSDEAPYDAPANPPPAPAKEPPPILRPVAPAVRPNTTAVSHRSKEPPPSASPQPEGGVDVNNGNLTLPIDGIKTASSNRPRLVLEQVCGGTLDPKEFIDESRAIPLYPEGEGGSQRYIATLKKVPEGVMLSPVDGREDVFVRVDSPVRLGSRTRFRIGDYIIEPRPYQPGSSTDPSPEPRPRCHSKELVTQGELVFLRPDGSDGTRFPILRKILIGRGGPGDKLVDIPLLDDNVSQRHASVTPTPNGLRLHDLKSRNGTFVQIRSPKILRAGDWFRVGEKVLHLAPYRQPG